jgi:hypothetical protein
MLRRYARTRGTAVKKNAPLGSERLPTLLASMTNGVATLRDRALILLRYAGAFRRSELVALDNICGSRRQDSTSGSPARRTTRGGPATKSTCHG